MNRRGRSHILAITPADLRQLRESRDFWVPLAVIAGFMFMVVPAVMLWVISTVQDPVLLSRLVDVAGRLPGPLRSSSAEPRRRSRLRTRSPSTSSRRSSPSCR